MHAFRALKDRMRFRYSNTLPQQTAPEDSKEDDVFSRRPFILLGTPPMTSWAIWSNRLPFHTFHTCFIHRSCRLHSQMCALVCAAWSSLEGEQRYFHLSCCSLVECFCKYLVNMEGLNFIDAMHTNICYA